jgi:hypothetical protein
MTPGGNIANPEQQVLSPLVGKWNCSGRFARSGKPIESTISFTPILDGNWMLVQHDDLPPNKFHALELWRYDKDSKRFTATLFDNFAKQERSFTSDDKGPEKLTWDRSMDGGVEQFVFELSGKQLSVGYQVKRPPATDWTLVDSLSCSQKQ